MNDDLIKPDTNKPVVPDMDTDIPSITPEPAAPAQQPPAATPDTDEPNSPEPVSPALPEPPKPAFSPTSSPAEPLLPSAASTPPVAPPHPAEPEHRQSKLVRLLLIVVVSLLLVAGIVYAAFAVGFNRGHTAGRKDQTAASAATAIKVPSNATMVAQCTAGAGTQYVMPSDIPQGPIYNVWNNKVTGIEFMLAQSKIAANKTLDIALKSQKYDHIDVMYEAAGHAGFTEPHYHLVLSMISYADEQKITCGSNSSNSTTHESHDMSSMGM